MGNSLCSQSFALTLHLSIIAFQSISQGYVTYMNNGDIHFCFSVIITL